ncbi:MAG TPA: alpha-glucosidase, partial [Pseudothermotoga sp.]
WYTTYFPQPTFISSKFYFCHFEASSYMIFDFTKDYTQIEIWQLPVTVKVYSADNWQDLFDKMTNVLGKQPKIAEWILDGAILGIQGGTHTMLEKIEKMRNKGLKIAGVWIQDWEGKRITTFGKQLMWNWQYSNELYPDLPKTIEELRKENIRVLGYINPFLALEGNLYEEASAKNFLVKKKNGEEYHVVVTTFPAAIVDLTNPFACEWLKDVIKKNMIQIGLSGWMADYGEYLPTDAILHNGEPAELVHNKFPVLWAQVNYEAVKESQRNDIVYFMRSGYSGSSRYVPLYWNGDQLVNWSKDDGLPSVIPATLSLGMNGIAFVHSDIGGYTTLAKTVPDMIKTVRSKELFLRWTELAAFTPVMRTHEGNWPDENWQFDSDEETIQHFVKMTDLHKKLKNYFLRCIDEYYKTGLPLIRPLFLHYDDSRCYTEQYEFLVGRDVLVSPVLSQGVREMNIYLPDDLWIHYWTGKEYFGGEHRVHVPIGEPAFFIRKEGERFWKD